MRILRYLLSVPPVMGFLIFLIFWFYVTALLYITGRVGFRFRVAFKFRHQDSELLGIDPNNDHHRLNYEAVEPLRNALPTLVRYSLDEKEISYQRSEEEKKKMASKGDDQRRIIIDCTPVEENRDVNYVCKVSSEEIDEAPKGPNLMADEKKATVISLQM